MRELPRVVADTPVGKDVPVMVVRKGKEETKTVKLGRLEDGERQAALTKNETPSGPESKSVVSKTLGLNSPTSTTSYVSATRSRIPSRAW